MAICPLVAGIGAAATAATAAHLGGKETRRRLSSSHQEAQPSMESPRNYDWQTILRGDSIPRGAVLAGYTGKDGVVYVAKNKHECGKLNTNDRSRTGTMWNIWTPKQRHSVTGEILVVKGTFEWVKVRTGDSIPPDAVYARCSSNAEENSPSRDIDTEVGNLTADENGMVRNMSFHSKWRSRREAEILCVHPEEFSRRVIVGDGELLDMSPSVQAFAVCRNLYRRAADGLARIADGTCSEVQHNQVGHGLRAFLRERSSAKYLSVVEVKSDISCTLTDRPASLLVCRCLEKTRPGSPISVAFEHEGLPAFGRFLSCKPPPFAWKKEYHPLTCKGRGNSGREIFLHHTNSTIEHRPTGLWLWVQPESGTVMLHATAKSEWDVVCAVSDSPVNGMLSMSRYRATCDVIMDSRLALLE
jgi:hypothetical protein